MGFPVQSLKVFPYKSISSLPNLLCLKQNHKAKVCTSMDRKCCVLKFGEKKMTLSQFCISRKNLCSPFTFLSYFPFVFPNIFDVNKFTLDADWSSNSYFVMWFWISVSGFFQSWFFLGFLKYVPFGLLVGCEYLVQLFAMLIAAAE